MDWDELFNPNTFQWLVKILHIQKGFRLIKKHKEFLKNN